MEAGIAECVERLCSPKANRAFPITPHTLSQKPTFLILRVLKVEFIVMCLGFIRESLLVSS
jgi:hypothetical protein